MSGHMKINPIIRLIILLSVMALAACTVKPAAPTPVPTTLPVSTTSPVSTLEITSTSLPTETPVALKKVDASTMEHKLLMGYQGWFTCPGDGSLVNGYFHWFTGNVPDAGKLKVAMWPDTSELTPGERCPTNMVLPNGQPATLYSAYNPKTVMRHFEWMSQYGIDGVFLQRFGSELSDPVFFDERNVVTKNVIAGAEATGRVFAIMYDTSNMDASTFVGELENDWKYLVDVLNVTESPSYLHQNGKPVVAIWGLGFTGHPGTPQQAMDLVKFFEKNPDPTLQVTLMGGVPTDWRTLQKDSLPDPGWSKYYCALNVISPWTVERFKSDVQVDQYKSTMLLDMAAASQCGAEYMPVVFPGFSNQNSGGSALNVTPRRGGNLYWRQVYNAVSIGVPMIYNAMFDEVDEGTAMYKIAATTNDQPVGVALVPLDADGINLPSDWYLRLAGAATKMLRGEIPLTINIPIQPGAATSTP
ncbi:MAG: glycoside hydrolase family 71/99-like protein [Anaerolineales bacterium]